MSDSTSFSWLRKVPFVGDRLADRLDGAPIVPVLRLSGVIGGSAPLRKGGLSLADLAEQIEHAFERPRAAAVALAINSPGGSPVQSSLIAKRIKDLSREKEVPVFAFCEDVAASGGYWLACAADEIYADASSIVGSIGVVSAGFGFPALLEKAGIERRVHTAGDKKAILDPFAPENPDDITHLKELQSEIHQQFKDHVRANRGDRLGGASGADEDLLFSGAFWTGERAVELGLVDGLGDLRTVMREKFGDKVRLPVMTEPKGWLQKRLGMSAVMTSAPSGWAPGGWASGLIGALDERAHWSRFGL
ncbi:MAG: S49 family peptidase [Rhodospirillaceae bacterium]|jgi:signal peptide peptidase SppA|nr:S49 family peptidase [Rhodospirillaceae bacterium]MBT5664193.1 S49 family peptidase [Rhodospirillaceae bacterium]